MVNLWIKRIRFRPVCIICLALFCFTGTVFAQVTDDIHGDTRETATTIQLSTSPTVSGRIEVGDIDYFRIVITESTTITIFTSSDLMSVTCILQSNSGNQLEANSDSGIGGNCLINYSFDPGTYYIRVETFFFMASGDYVLHLGADDDYGDTRATATPLQLDTVTEGIIAPITSGERDTDYFEIKITEPTLVNIFTTDDLDTLGELQDDNGQVLETDDDEGDEKNFLITRNLPAGTYYIRVRGVNTFEIGAYVLYVDVEDHGRSAETATFVELNTMTSGTIIYSDDIDYFEIEITEQTPLHIFTTGASDRVTSGTLLDSEQRPIDSEQGVFSGNRNFLIHAYLEPETYYIAVDIEGVGTPVGDYILHVLTDDYGNTTRTSTTIGLNTAVSGRIEEGNDRDYFKIVITEPTAVEVFTTGNLDTGGRLLDDKDNRLEDGDEELSPNFLIISSSLDPGIYYIEVNTFGDVGDYVLHVRTDNHMLVLADDHGNVPATATTNLSLNTSVSGTIGYENDIDYFRIEIIDPTQVEIFTTGDLDVAGMLLDNNLDSLASDDNGGENNNFLISTDLQSGTYYIRVNSVGSAVGDYILDILGILDMNTDDYGNTIETATEIELNTATPGTIERRDDVDYFRIEIINPTLVEIFTTGDLDVEGELQDDMGGFLEYSDNEGENNNLLINARLQAGIYYIRVNITNVAVGDYILHVRTDDHGNTIETATEIELDTTTSGTIEREGNVDYFRIELADPTLVEIFTTGDLDTEGDLLEVDLLNNRISFLIYSDNDGENNNFLISTSLDSGTYYIAVNSVGSAVGDYTLHVRTDDYGDTIATATTILLNTDISGRIEYENDADYFSIEITEPSIATIFTTGNLDTVGRLEDELGNELNQDDNGGADSNFRIQTRLDQGIYYIEVGSDPTTSGDYVLHVNADDHGNTSGTATLVPLNTSVSGRIELEGNVDYFRIDITEPLTVTIFTTGNLDTLGRLEDELGDELMSGDDEGADLNFRIQTRLNTGRYYIRVNSFNSAVGDYVLHVNDADELVPQISLIIPSSLAESTNEVIGSTMIDVKHGEAFPVHINVTAFEAADTLTLTLDGPQNAALPTILMTSALSAGGIWTDFYLGYGPSEGTGEASYRYCQSGTQNCSSSILVSYSPPAAPVVDVDDRYGVEWDFTLSNQTATTGCTPGDPGTFPTSFSQEGNMFTSTGETTLYTGIVDGSSYSLAYRDPNLDGGSYIDKIVMQYSGEPDPVALSGPGVWWWTDRAGFLCRGTYDIRYTPRPHLESIIADSMLVSEDTGNVTITITLTHPPVQPVAAMLEIEGTATTDADYDNVERNINFGIGEKQTTLNLVIVDDSLVEPDETIILKVVSQDPNKLVGESSTTLTIEDNDVPAISFEQAEYTIDEGTTGTIILRADQNPLVAAQIELTADSATIEDGEYQLSATVVVFEAGQSTASFEVSISDDNDVQATRELSLSLSPLNNSATRGTTYETVISIRNNDVPAISFEQAEYTIDEGTTGTIILRADQNPLVAAQIELTADSATIADGEYQLSATVVVFEAGQSTASFEVSISDDDIVRSTRELSLSLAPLGGSATRGTPHETVISIGNNDVSEVTLAVVGNDILLVEGDITTLQITLARAFDQETSVRIVTAGTATTDDYTIAMNPVIFAAYNTYAETTLRITKDGDESERDESIILTLAANNDLIITDRPEAKLTLTIASNIPAISFEQAEYIIEEGTTGTITLIVSPLPALETRVELTTLLGTTVADGKYRLSTTVIVFEAGQSTASFEVSISDEDGFSNPLRELRLSFVLLDNNAIYRATSETVITVSEGQPMVWLGTPREVVTEGEVAMLPIETDRLTAEPLSVTLLYTSEGANTGVSALTGEFLLAPDVSTMITINTHIRTTQTFDVEVVDDSRAAEFTQSVNIVLQPGDGYSVVDDSGNRRYDNTILAVMDNDFAEVFFSQAGGTVTEGEPIELIVRRDLETAIVTRVSIEFTTTGNFFESMPIPAVQLSFPAGVAMSTQKIVIPTVGDFNVEADGMLRAEVVIIPGSPLRPGTPDVRTVTILDDDVPAAISFEQAEYIIDEGTTGTITLTASPLPLVETRVELTTLMGTTVGKYRLSTTVIVFEAGQSTASFEVSISDEDGFSNPLRELRLSFVLLDNNAIYRATSETVITVSEGQPMVWLGTPREVVTEGEVAMLPIETDRLTAEPLSVTLLYTSEGANTGVSALTGEFLLAPDVSTMITINTHIRTTQTFDVEVVDDSRAAEFTQSVNIVLQPGDGYSVVDDSGNRRYDNTILAVMDNDFAEVFFSQAGGTVTEGEPIELIVRRDLETAIVTRVSIEFTTTGNFFESTPIPAVQLSFPAGVAMSTQKIVIPTVDDLNVEADGMLRAEIMIIPGSPLRPGTPDMRTVTILDNDVPAISFEQAEYTIVEGTTGTIILEADQIPVREAQIELTTLSATTIAEDDYRLPTTVVVFGPGQSTASFEVSISDDIDDEVDVITRSLGKLSLSISPLNNSAIRGTTPDTVINAENNDTSSVTLTVAGDVTTLEERDSASATLQITLTRAFDEDTNITIVTGGTVDPADYTIDDNPVVLLANTTFTEIVLTVTNDNLVEEDETIILTLAAENPLVRGDGPEGTQLTLTIEDNDVPPISFEQAEYTIVEGTTSTIILRAEQTPLVAAQIELTADSEMVADGEYQLSTTIVVFEPGQTTASFEVSIFDDDIVQSTRELSLSISPLNNSAIRETTPDTVINVENNDTSSVTLTVAGGVTMLEEGNRTTLRVTLTHAFDQETTIHIVTDGTVDKNDYTIDMNPVVFEAYSTYAETTLTVTNDDLPELNETIILSLDAHSDLIIDEPRAQLTLTIADNDVPAISLIIPSSLAESTNEVIGSTMIDVKHGEPFPVHINVTAFDSADTLTLTLDGPQNAALPTTLMTSALSAGGIWTDFYLGYGPSEGTGEASYRYCQSGTQNCSSSILVSYSPPAAPVVDVDDRYGAEWDFTLSNETATNGCTPGDPGTFPTSFSQEGNMFTSIGSTTYTGIVDGNSYSLAYRHPNLNGGTYIDTLATQYSPDPVALSGPGVWWWTDKAGFLCRGTYDIRYTPRPHLESIITDSMSVSEDIGNATITITLTHPPVQPVVAMLEIEGTATEADYAVERNINFGIGEKQTTLNLVIVDDSLVEPDETIILKVVSQDSNKLVGESSTTLAIVDNDVPAISFEQAEYTITEGTTGTIILRAEQTPLVTAQIELTADSAMVENNEYQLSTTIVVFEPGQTTASFEVGIVDDEVVRSTRELSLSFDLPDGNAKHGATSKTVISVANNDTSSVTLTVAGGVTTLVEGATAILRVTLTHAFDEDTSITIETGGSATPGTDYTISPNPVVLRANSFSAETTLSITMDGDDSEPDETIILTLEANDPLVIGDGPDGAKLTLTIGQAMLFFRIKVFLEGAQ